ncbi:MAG: hypothetical protein COW27_02060 [Nitrosopumilales archaeon CG15_BIG_FIL_POST_REV_8_21_14_020_37_12]|nr:MAG: hypothetical protein COW27_02060 [Nitrosopumilales archaeon CG15_BIG_FIL_POST_REV_8_21_14_020_37_12]
MSIQILQYEFLGPIKLDEWGPPMEKVVYLILSRTNDTFQTLYVGECEKTDDIGFFTKHSLFKCWVEKSRSEKSLYLAILPMFDAPPIQRRQVSAKIISRYRPDCNQEPAAKQPDYTVRPKQDSGTSPTSEKIHCPCCGSEMRVEKVMEKSSIVRCSECGLSDTKLNS